MSTPEDAITERAARALARLVGVYGFDASRALEAVRALGEEEDGADDEEDVRACVDKLIDDGMRRSRRTGAGDVDDVRALSRCLRVADDAGEIVRIVRDGARTVGVSDVRLRRLRAVRQRARKGALGGERTRVRDIVG